MPAQFIPEKWTMRIAGHSHSPLFVDEGRELAAALFKANAIDREMLIRLLNPPQRDNMIFALRERIKAEAAERARNPAGAARASGGKASRKEAPHGPQA